jgi:HD-GYP domain-containing protein (c-di-GMP phosphodiesterase class II)
VTLDSYSSPEAEALILSGRERLHRWRRRRELVANAVGAGAFAVVAGLIAVLAPWEPSFSLPTLLLVLGVWIIVDLVKFPVASAWTYPTMLIFVPALFLLPTPLVPLVAVAAKILRRVPDHLSGRVPLSMVPIAFADAWFTIGPVLVIVLAGAQHFAWSHWPVYVAALAAQLLFDMVASVGLDWAGEGIPPRVQLPLLSWIYIVDITFAPLGLVIAAVAVQRPALVLLALSPIAILWLFARERTQRLDETLALSTAYRGTAMLLGDVVEADHHYTGAHSRDVVELSLAVADELGLDPSQRRNVEFAALLHDVGKIHVPKEIINKPGKLDEHEWGIMRQHTIDGERMLEQVGGLLANIGHIVRASHEHYGGGGYPDGLSGDEIPVEARIVTACDAYSAMTTDRPYRKAMPKADALAELGRCAGTQFDPRVADAIQSLETASLTDRRAWLEHLGSATPDGAALAAQDRPVVDPQRLPRVELDRAAHDHVPAERYVAPHDEALGVP